MMPSAPATPRGSRDFTPATYDRPPNPQASASEDPIPQALLSSCGLCRARESCISCRACVNCRTCPACRECRMCRPKKGTEDFDSCICSKRFGGEYLFCFISDIIFFASFFGGYLKTCGVPLLPLYILTSLSYVGQSIFLVLRSRYYDEPHRRPCQWPDLLSWQWKYLLFDLIFLWHIPKVVALMYAMAGVKKESSVIVAVVLVMSVYMVPFNLMFIYDIRSKALRMAKEGGEYAYLPRDEFEVHEDDSKGEEDTGEEELGKKKGEEKKKFVYQKYAMLASFMGLIILLVGIWMLDKRLNKTPGNTDGQDLRVKEWLKDAASAYLRRVGSAEHSAVEDGPDS
ncbi:hypothetical protein BZA77DRAFT_30513 [Pyronema omphalodes]|nr:hypothetical protein BZA77DRAFT_30513 [Pyronema omphalodes]